MALFRRNAISLDGIWINAAKSGSHGRSVWHMLSDTRIRKAKPKGSAYQLTDGHGLFLLVTPTGGNLWRWKYRFDGAQKQMSYGKYPDVSLPDARDRHAAARKLLAAGTDPMAQRKADKTALRASAANSFKTVALLWHEHWKDGKSAHHVDATWSRLESNVFPAFGDVAITRIEAPEIVRMVKAIQDRGKVDIAKRGLETTGQIFRYAVAHGLATRNPAADIKPGDILKSRQKVNHARVDAKELPTLLRAIEVYQGKHVTRLAMKLMAMTFIRTAELIGGRWEEIDWEAKRWNIPKERMKMKTPHIIPLSTQGVEVLELLRTITGGGELLFPGDRSPKKPMSNMTILEALKRMGYTGTMTGHGFRGLASTILHEQGYEHAHIELQLAHAPRNAVSAAYNHALYLSQRSKMMQEWADFLEQTQRGGKVIPFRPGEA
jgi:integrase